MNKTSTKRISKPPTNTDINQKQTNKTISALRIQQKNAIQNLDYDTAEIIEKQIRDERLASIEYLFQQRCDEFRQRLIQLVADSFAELDHIRERYKEEEHQIRIRINSDFETLRDKQVNELISLEKDYAAARLRETERTIPEQEELLQKSKNAALTKDFELARNFREAAALLAETDLETRLAKVDTDFEGIRKSTLSKQKEDVEYLSRRLDEELKTAEERNRLKLKKEDTNRNVKIIGHFEKYSSLVCGVVDTSEAPVRIKKLDQLCTEVLFNMNCPKPKGVGDTSATNSTLDAARSQSTKRSKSRTDKPSSSRARK